MRQGRIVWAAAMCALAVTVLAGYSAAGPAAGAAETPEKEAAPAESVEAPKERFAVVVRNETGENRRLTVTDKRGGEHGTVLPNERREYVLYLAPGRYTLTLEGGFTTTFTLAENASIADPTPPAWTDGELLHLGDPYAALPAHGEAAQVITSSIPAKTIPGLYR